MDFPVGTLWFLVLFIFCILPDCPDGPDGPDSPPDKPKVDQ